MKNRTFIIHRFPFLQVFKDSSPSVPLIFVLSPGTDPAVALYKFAEEMRFSKKLNAISLGQGQGPRAEALMRSAMERGKWVFFQVINRRVNFFNKTNVPD